ncbi:glycosyltransferase family 4 protein [Klebsiella aerogenes]
MKILMVNTLYAPYKIGGAEKSVQLLAEELAAKGHEVTVATLHDNVEIESIHMNGVNVVRFPLKNIYWPYTEKHSFIRRCVWHINDIYNKKMLSLVAGYFAKNEFDVVHTNNLTGFSVAIWTWAKNREIPIVHTSRDYSLIHPNGTLFKKGRNMDPLCLESRLYSFIKKQISNNVSVYVGISDYIKKVHVQTGFFQKSENTVIYNSITANQCVKRHGSDKIVLGYLGRIEEEKGVEVLLNALSKLRGMEIKIAGKGSEDYIKYLNEKYSSIPMSFLGVVNASDFFPQIDYLIVPSMWNEPLGRVVLEAASFGIPSIGSAKGGIPEIIKDRHTGYIFNSESQLIDVLNIINDKSKDDYFSMSKNVWDYSLQFDSGLIVDKYTRAYELARISRNKR